MNWAQPTLAECIVRRCYIHLARAGNGLRATVAGPASYQVRFQSNCLIFAKKMRKDIHKKGEPKARYRV
ncbi:MAG: hypothetical protein VB140_10095, partial [Burkholderia sp.]